MKKGQIVIVYFDPITRTQKEGSAKLMHKLTERTDKDYRLETWSIKFLKSGIVCTRTVREDLNQEVML
jgi:hypothetical protein